MVLASDLVNEDLCSNMESDTEVNVSDFFLQYKLQNKSNQKFFVANQFLLAMIANQFLLAMIANQIFLSISSRAVDHVIQS